MVDPLLSANTKRKQMSDPVPLSAIRATGEGIVPIGTDGANGVKVLSATDLLAAITLAIVEAPTAEPVATGVLWLNNDVLTLSAGIPPVITDQPDNATFGEGQTVTFAVVATNATSYQWQLDSGSGYADISGATSASYTTPALIEGDSGNAYRCNVTGPGGSVTSDAATLTLSAPPSISAEPTDQLVADNATATFAVTATGGSLSYQWQVNDGTGDGWANVGGATSSSYTTAALAVSDTGRCYRCRIHNSRGRVMSNIAVCVVGFSGTTYYVDSVAGNNGNDGLSVGAPLATVTAAITKTTSNAGDKILIKRGSTFSTQASYSGKNKVYTGVYGSGAKPIFNGGGTVDQITTGTTSTATGCVFSDLAVTNAAHSALTLAAGGTVIRVDGTTSGDQIFQNITTGTVRLIDCTATGAVDDGISVHSGPTVIIIGGDYSANSQGVQALSGSTVRAYGVRFASNTSDNFSVGSAATVIHCTFVGSGASSSLSLPTGSVFRGNIVDCRGVTPVAKRTLQSTGTLSSYHNTYFGNGNGSIDTTAAAVVTAKNDIYYDLNRVYLVTSGAVVNLDYCSRFSITTPNATSDTNAVAGTPLFADGAALDLRPTLASPCKAAGTSGLLSLDCWGWDFDPSTPSIGAFEYYSAN
jgi:hypothetical protein